MNAAPALSQSQPLSDSVQPNASASASAATPRADSQDFARALSDASGKPARKSAVSKQQDTASSGSALPTPGNQPPPAAAPAANSAEAPRTAESAGAIQGTPGSTVGPDPVAIGAGSGPAGQASAGGAAALPIPANLDLAAAPALASGAAQTAAASSPAAAGSGLKMPQAPSNRALAPAGASNRAPAVLPGTADSKSGGAVANQGTAVSSTASSTDVSVLNDQTSGYASAATGTTAAGTAASGTAAAASDAAAQADIAAAMQGTNTSSPSNSFANDSSPADAGPQGIAGLSDPLAGAPAALFQASVAATSAVTAATAAAQAISSAAGAAAADKRSHGSGPDSLLSGVSSDGSAGAAQLLTSNASTDNLSTPTFKVEAGVDTAQFGQGVADRISTMMDSNLISAKLQVNPPALGPIEVRIALQGGHAQIWLSSHSALTRDALESSSPKLQEMLNSQGFSQVSVDISHRSFQERSPQSQAYEAAPASGGDAPVLAHAVSISRSTSGLLDAYA
jgi:flagellar hook-length control protein FliK